MSDSEPNQERTSPKAEPESAVQTTIHIPPVDEWFYEDPLTEEQRAELFADKVRNQRRR